MILVIDNFDSFVFNLARYVVNTGKQVHIARNNQLTIPDIINLNPSHIIISPGPGNPDSAGISLQLVQQLYTIYPILGVCLGHQVIGQAFGATVIRATTPMHGKASLVNFTPSRLFAGLPSQFKVGRYHSLIIEQSNISQQVLTTTAYCNDKQIMAIEHKTFPVYGIQFHPESILTEYGMQILENFLQTST